MAILKTGQCLITGSGQVVEVRDLIGSGGQAEVYRVTINDQPHALKWYHQPVTPAQEAWAKDQRRALQDYLLAHEPPDSRFVWPLDLADDAEGRTFGYVMPLMPERFQGLERLVLGKMKPAPKFKVLCQAAIGLSECFRKLHTMGACYKDINLGGPFIDPTNGDVMVCDLDNVRVNKTPGNIIFVYFAAPELILGKGECQTNTDIHSLAVLLFYMFVRQHPLSGRRELQVNVFNEAAQRKFFGRHPVFIFDPDDDSNRPVEGFHDQAIRNWTLYPRFLKRLFTRAFTVGLTDPNRRVRTIEWMEAFSKLRDSLIYCYGCGSENFHDFDETQPGTPKCWRCGNELKLPLRLDVGQHRVMLNHDSVVFPHHMGRSLDFTAPVAEVSRHPKKPDVWGVRNLSPQSWTYTTRDNEQRQVEPGRTVPLRNGLIVDFGGIRGAVVR